MMMRHTFFARCRLAASVAFVAVAAFAAGACVDLAEPRLPNLGAPAFLSLTLRQIPGLPFEVTGSLTAGRDSSGIRRRLLSPLVVVTQPITFGEPNAQGSYLISVKPPIPAAYTGPFEVQPPIIEGVAAPVTFRWWGIRRLDPDTVRPDALGDVALHVESELGPAVPASRSQQWFLELRGDFGSIRVSGDGPPPTTLRIPSQFIPAAPDKRVEISLIYFQSATTIPAPGNYIAAVTLDTRVAWVLKLP
ncbi:MAG: hypothetical protein ABIV28_04200 [Longimicrobiales bacterium]